MRTLAIAAIALLLALPAASAQTTGDLFLTSDGQLAAQPGSPSTCLSLAPTGPNTAQATFRGSTSALAAQTAVLDLALAQGANPGTGFRIDALLRSGNATAEATRTYSAGAAIDSPATLSLELEQPAGGELELVLTLTKQGAVPVGQSVSIQCGTTVSRVHALTLAAGPPLVENPEEEGHDEHGEGPAPGIVLLIALGAGAVTLVAGLMVLVGKSITPRRLHLFLGLTAGLLMAIAIVDLIPEAIEEGGEGVAITIALSLLAMFLIKALAGDTHDHGHAGHDHAGHQDHLATHSRQFALVAFVALLIHRVVDGLALPGAFAAGDAIGFAASSAVLIHQFPDGLAAASVLLAGGLPRRRVILGVAILAAATPIGAGVGLLLASAEGFLPYLLGIAAATFLFIALGELLPELRARQYRYVVIGGVLLGYAVAALLEVAAMILGVGH